MQLSGTPAYATYLLSVYGHLESMRQVSAFVDAVFAFVNAQPLYCSGNRDRLGSFKRNRSKIAESKGAEVRGSRNARADMAECEFELSIIQSLDQPLPTLSFQVPTDSVEAKWLIARVRELLSVIDYGYVMPTTAINGEAWYALGMVAFERYGLAGPESDDIGLWDQEQHRKHNKFGGRLRDVYPINLLGSSQATLIHLITEWGQRHPGKIEIEKELDLYVISVPSFSARQELRQELRRHGKIICQHPFPGDGPDERRRWP